jgi:hypothetical protein
MSDPLRRFAERWGAESPEEAMLRAVGELAARTGDGRAPHPLAPAARALGARIRVEDIPGCVLRLDGTPEVLIPRRAWRTWRRQRFGIAHELCHLLVWRAVPTRERPALQDPTLHDRLERVCDLGAAELLMPRAEFRRDLEASGFHSAGLADLYDRYLVSWMSLMNRMSSVLSDVGLSLWRQGARAHDPHDLPRVVASWGWSALTYLPPGISERHLSRTMITSALQLGRAWTMDLRLEFVSGQPSVAAIACPMPRPRDSQEPLPLWGGRPVPDESRVYAHAALLVSAGRDAGTTLRRLGGDDGIGAETAVRPLTGAVTQG